MVDSSNRIIVKGVPLTASHSDIAECFAPFGEYSDIFLPPPIPGADQRKRCCFVTFADPNSAALVVHYPEHLVGGQKVDVELAGTGSAGPSKSLDNGSLLQTLVGDDPGSRMAQTTASSISGFRGGYAGGQAGGQKPKQSYEGCTVTYEKSYGWQSGGSSSGGGAAENSNRIIIKGVPLEFGQIEVGEYFAYFGECSDVFLPPQHPGSDQHKGCCFVTFVDPSSAAAAMRYEQHFIGGQKVDVEFADPRPGKGGKGGKGDKGKGDKGAKGGKKGGKGEKGQKHRERLFIANLPSTFTELDLQLHFEPIGDVVDVYVPPVIGGRGEHKGIGFVTFADRDDLARALEMPHVIRGMPLSCELATESWQRESWKGGGKGGYSPY